MLFRLFIIVLYCRSTSPHNATTVLPTLAIAKQLTKTGQFTARVHLHLERTEMGASEQFTTKGFST